jgi:hypothetical protein
MRPEFFEFVYLRSPQHSMLGWNLEASIEASISFFKQSRNEK